MTYGKSQAGSIQATPMEQLIIWLREDLIGEFEAINQYQLHIDNIDNEEIKTLLSHIRDEEKEHVAEITHALARIDAIQREKFMEDHTVAPEERVVQPVDDSTATTVGNLFGKK
ncbi:Hypothetical protein LUCI_4712 [Lucifera butyrica]|uniref:Rubrerythrin n=1 Tax=Lucifera butyrica TaxID=1351585 RepID=A0A498RH57_9FIRM|nr:ferritin-like domain-containing protein [Lucifera butyrica]VBB09422.1 Hypothetical protein LUCI_4712 [Lucifera butyrica]